MYFPSYRGRRLRRNPNLRRMVRETYLHVEDLIYPMFSAFGENIKKEIASMPGIYQQSIENIVSVSQRKRMPSAVMRSATAASSRTPSGRSKQRFPN